MVSRPTLSHVSQKAGVSLFTASRALRDGEGVAAKTVTRVRAAAEELGYVPNSVARALRGASTHTIGLLTANVVNRFFGTLLQGINGVFAKTDYQVLSGDAVDENGVYQVDAEQRFVRSLLQSRVSGAIVTYSVAEANVRALADWDIPIVFVDCLPPSGHDYLPSVVTDNHLGGILAGRHLAEHGYRHWLFVGHIGSWSTRQGREQGFLEAAAECGARIDRLEGGNSSRVAFGAVADYLTRHRGSGRPDALFATNELLLHGALRALAEVAAPVGHGFGVIGFDDFEWATLLDPPVTAVDQHIVELGTGAAEILLELMDPANRRDARRPAPKVVLPPRLVVRRSCGCLPTKRVARLRQPSPRQRTKKEE